MAEFFEVTDDVLELAQSVIRQYHPELQGARIAFIFRDEVQKSGGKEIWGQASKVTPKYQPYVDAEFIIWLAADIWKTLPPMSKQALIDHELYHCQYDNVEDKASIRPHDIEEFYPILERYGLWRSDLARGFGAMNQAVQMRMDMGAELEENVFALAPDKVPAEI